MPGDDPFAADDLTGAAELGAALAASLASFLVMGTLDLTFLKDWVLLIFWLLAALCARISDGFRLSAEPAREG